MKDIPIMKFELDCLKASIKSAFTGHLDEVSKMINESIDYYCNSESIKKEIDLQVKMVINTVAEEEIKRFYYSGEGRAHIEEAVRETLSRIKNKKNKKKENNND